MNLSGGREAISVPQNVKAWEIDPYSKEVLQNIETIF